MKDAAYLNLPYKTPEITHRYGDKVHILAEPFTTSLLARFCADETQQPEITELVRLLYGSLLRAALNAELPQKVARIETRMIHHNPEGIYEGSVLEPQTKTVVVNIARAGYLPSQVCYDLLNRALDPRLVRVDHIFMNRKVDEANQVIGVEFSGSKIGGDVDDAFIMFPDPMGATGGSMDEAMNIYKKDVKGAPRKFIALHLIVTPEYLKRMKDTQPEASIYALRVDRGLSAPDVLQTTPGERWAEERGLNSNQYIVPGAGGIGEILNNSFV